EPAIRAVEEGRTRFVPENWAKTYFHWMRNIEPWCISRQLWWGHQVPAWYAPDNHVFVEMDEAAAKEAARKHYGKEVALRRDPDVLDTWFSSALWPFSTLGWPEKTRALSTFYPNNVLVTGPDIIFFWVARMMMFGIHFMGKVPFRTVYLTSIVTDENGDKMAKMKGNVIDPLDVVYGATLDVLLQRVDSEKSAVDPEIIKRAVKKHFGKGIPSMGADALRFTLAALNTGSSRIRLSVEKVEVYRNFINKLWNASRFALMNLDGFDPERFEAQIKTPTGKAQLGMPERWILSRLQATAGAVNTALEAYRFADAANAIYHFVWDELCDWYIELAKPHLHKGAELQQDSEKAARRHVVQGVLATALETTMRLFHPFAPFVTEEIWQKLPKLSHLPGSLMITKFPDFEQQWVDQAAEAEMGLVQQVVTTARMLRQTYNIKPNETVAIELRVAADAPRATLEKYRDMVDGRAKVKATITAGGDPMPEAAKALVGADVQVLVPIGGLGLDADAETKRISNEIGKCEKEIAALEKKLANPDFLSRAPEEVVAEIRQRLADEKQRLQVLMDALKTLALVKKK
ncbi:MAG TPA: class I tRNA ligase family protein, partial [Kofleriaceae bacterium]